eukprot:gnl/TRDRNA2_/TRDRNA2_169997_c0_seq1.p1 gnl/TRDRNA2_/TRDRNA2_169997_c0~~gnl/TRDRNA2_/TRDRNA2_169997_c0_seq1.p1  ORF type:complete len:302 (-),score=22.15 gnl/TRDRNA2_/TRDRNA2_169997_c0_seq1:69-902(-)
MVPSDSIPHGALSQSTATEMSPGSTLHGASSHRTVALRNTATTPMSEQLQIQPVMGDNNGDAKQQCFKCGGQGVCHDCSSRHGWGCGPNKCTGCHGCGYIGDKQKCYKCNGRGFCHDTSMPHDKEPKCFFCTNCTGCSGSGYIECDKQQCFKCGGRGFCHDNTAFSHFREPRCTFCSDCTNCGGCGYMNGGNGSAAMVARPPQAVMVTPDEICMEYGQSVAAVSALHAERNGSKSSCQACMMIVCRSVCYCGSCCCCCNCCCGCAPIPLYISKWVDV